MKKLVSLALSAVMACGVAASLAACDNNNSGSSGAKVEDYEFKPVAAKDLKVGLICLHDEDSTYDKNFLDAMEKAVEAKGVTLLKQLNKPEDSECYDAAADLVSQGCKVIFADSFGHEAYMMEAAAKYPGVQFCHATGTKSQTHNLGNYHNAFASIYEGRYLAGVAAGMKLKTMTPKEANGSKYYQIGYVGAFPYAEVISGYTSFYLGVQSVLEETVKMDVTYTYSWYSPTDEQAGAEFLIKTKKAQLISQHADSMGAPNACEAAGVPNVTYNVSTKEKCPKTYVAGSRINWQPYFEYMIDCVINGEQIKTDWTGNLSTGSVEVLELGSAAAEGTPAKKIGRAHV